LVTKLSSAVCAEMMSDLVLASWPLPFWLRNAGMATAAKIPMMRITTRSSMRVKPP
jgi:hypothetical protein